MKQVDMKALIQVKACKEKLSPQAYRTLRGQVLAGDGDGALKGLRKLLSKERG